MALYGELVDVASIYLNSWVLDSTTISSSDTTLLNTICDGDLFYDGNAVAAACALLDIDFSNAIGGQSILPQLSKLKLSFIIYPNPANESVSLEYYLSEGSANLRIMDLMGRLVANYSINSEENIFTFNVKNLIEGVYFIQIDQNDRNLYTNKFIVIKK